MVKQIVIKLGRQLFMSRMGKENNLRSDGLIRKNQIEVIYSLRQVVDDKEPKPDEKMEDESCR